jgi:hypothetical protein
VTENQTRRRLARAALILAVAGGVFAFACWPHTNPVIIHAKVQVLGAGATYRPLADVCGLLTFDCPNTDRWDEVVRGVGSGRHEWLVVAVDLHPALDTHPSEALHEAIARVFEKNPVGALTTLLPVYGAQDVCGSGRGEPVARDTAARRLAVLDGPAVARVPRPLVKACRNAVASVSDGTRMR